MKVVINDGIFNLDGIIWQLHCFFQRHGALISNLITTWREFQHSKFCSKITWCIKEYNFGTRRRKKFILLNPWKVLHGLFPLLVFYLIKKSHMFVSIT